MHALSLDYSICFPFEAVFYGDTYFFSPLFRINLQNPDIRIRWSQLLVSLLFYFFFYALLMLNVKKAFQSHVVCPPPYVFSFFLFFCPSLATLKYGLTHPHAS